MFGIDIIYKLAASSFLLWVGYLFAMAAYKRKLAGTLTGPALWVCAVLVLWIAVIDVIYNFTWGSLMFWQFPPPELSRVPQTWTFTSRCKWWLTHPDGSIRFQLAYVICHYLLDPFAPDGRHCE